MVKEAIVKEPEPKQPKKWVVGQVAKTTEDVVVNSETNEAYTTQEALCLILNKLDETL